jgi:apolipoprotein N-acyltransferase
MEFGRTVLIASTNGISGVIAPDGQVLERTRQGTRAILSTDLWARTGLTMSARLGPWPERTMALGGLVPVGVVLVRSGRRRRAAVNRRAQCSAPSSLRAHRLPPVRSKTST